MRQHYERILYPYDVFLSGATIGSEFGLFEKKTLIEENKSESNTVIKAEKNQNSVNDLSREEESKSEVVKVENEEPKPETRQLRVSPRRLAQKSQARSINSEPKFLKFEKVEISSEPTNCSQNSEEQNQETSKQTNDRTDSIQLRPSPRRLARRMQAQQRRTTFPRVDKGNSIYVNRSFSEKSIFISF